LRHADVFQIFGNAAARNSRVKCFGVRQIATALAGQSAFAGQTACDLSSAVSAEIEVDDGIIIANRRDRAAAIINAGEGNNKFVGDIPILRVLHPLDRIDKLTALGFSGDHGIKSF
jgi:hypothetical protein